MKHQFVLLSFIVMTAIFFSCATAPIREPVTAQSAEAEVVDMALKPDAPESPEAKNAFPLPVPRIETDKNEKTDLDSGRSGSADDASGQCRSSKQPPVVAPAPETDKKTVTVQPAPVEGQKTLVSPVETSRNTPQESIAPQVTETTVIPVVNTASNDETGGEGQLNDRVRTIYARKGDEIEISFKENGWLLLDMPKQGAGIIFLDRSIEDGKTLFKFRGTGIGTFTLPFQYQDHLKGVMRREIIEVKVVSEEDFDAIMGQRGSETDNASRQKRRENAARLADLGRYHEALGEYLAAYTAGDPGLNETIATLAFLDKNYATAAAYWTKNLKEKGVFHDKAVIGLVKTAMVTNDRGALSALLQDLLRVENFPIEEELAGLIRYFNTGNDDTQLYDLLDEYGRRFPQGRYSDEILYFLGMLCERHAPIRNFTRAREYYRRVVREYPESRYFLPSRERIEYIERHYLKVQ